MNETKTVELEKELEQREKKLGIFEKYLPLWVIVCIILGILLSQLLPGVSSFIDSLKIGDISIPIGICLFLMMYPAMLNFQVSELKKLGRDPKPIILTLVSNWLIAPFIGLLMANIFLVDQQLIVAIILLSSSPCTAMVLVWGWMARGNQEQNVITTSLNTVTIMIGYVPMVSLLTGIQNIPVNQLLLLISLIFFIGLPLLLGVLSKRFIISKKGEDYFEHSYRPFVGKVSIIALLSTLVILFSLNGDVLLKNPDLMLIVSVPLLLGFAIVVGFNIIITRLTKLKYKEAIITVIIGSSSHFEIAIATAITMYGVGSIAALGTTMGLFWEVPVMLSLVYLGRYLGKHNFWNDRKNQKKTK
ncbi:MAG: arsenical-resistance protein [Candidatus Lokiarchaeota archaeon]|nr:arsenical-resistance protein [Candidatus Lokiarchaeota archaeon]MBD3200693.1 arsenical-resistance protein [Candidatus Lokiarchaeota archaeon]